MHGLTGGDWKRNRDKRKPRQSPTLRNRYIHRCLSRLWWWKVWLWRW
jgi:hypothetical protein